MPPLSTHFRFTTLLTPLLDIASHSGHFLLGTTAPDAFEPENEESFAQHHFTGEDGRISLESFSKQTKFILQPCHDPSWSFQCGYYSHLWLDVFFREHADCLPIKRPSGMTDTDLRKLVRRETEILNAPFVLSLALPQLEDLRLPVGLEFVQPALALQLFHDVVKQSQAWSRLSPAFETMDEAEYAAFFRNATQLFIKEFQRQ
jgi:hypothetical protein